MQLNVLRQTYIFKNRFSICFLVFLCLLPCSLVFAQQEEILSYNSDITILQNGELSLIETIRVQANGDKIRHGIYRDFPTNYRDHLGHAYKVGFDVSEVLFDGNSSPYHLKNLSNGVRVYIGSEKELVSSGIHDYVIKFTTNRQIGFMNDYDELYFNAIGLGWEFPIQYGAAIVRLPYPAPASDLKFFGFTGYSGSKDKNYSAYVSGDGSVVFKTTAPLAAHEGLSIVVQWPKGHVHEPTSAEKWRYFLHDNRDVLIGFLGLILAFAYQLYAWFKFGRDPQKGIIIPLYSAPAGLSPAGCRFLTKMSFDKKAMTASIINLAVKGYVTISQEGKQFLVSKTKVGTQELSADESAVLDQLLVADSIVLDDSNYRRVQLALSGCEKELKTAYAGKLFQTNASTLLPALGLFIVSLIGMFISQSSNPGALFNLGNILVVILFVILFVVFLRLMKCPTPEGQVLRDQIEGFKMYLETAEGDRLNQEAPPQTTPEIFEKFLPFAIALGVENAWSQKLAKALAIAGTEAEQYRPLWYNGYGYDRFDAHSFSSSVGSALTSSIAASSSPPGSSSGSSGSSGGGGGGGGGGGW